MENTKNYHPTINPRQNYDIKINKYRIAREWRSAATKLYEIALESNPCARCKRNE